MKVNITVSNPNCLNGYLNLDPIIVEAGISKVKADITNLDNYLDTAECSEIRACNVLTYYDSNTIDNIINNWISKIRLNGTIYLSEIDVDKVYKAFSRGEINITSLNILLFGEQNQKWDFKKSVLNMDVVSEALRAKGLEIIEKSYHNFNFIIKAKRVKNGS